MSTSAQGADERWSETLRAVYAWRSGLSSAAAAELRRCRTSLDVEMHPEFYRLRRSLPSSAALDKRQLPLLVGLSAHISAPSGDVERAGPGDFAALCGQKVSNAIDKPRISEPRFRRLLATESADEAYSSVVRLLRALRGQVSLAMLWSALAWWNTRARRAWAQAYYENN